MFRWLIVIFLVLVVANGMTPLLKKLGIGKLPGDFRFKLFGREWFLPVATTALLTVLASVIARFV
jgi:hypothetical protein